MRRTHLSKRHLALKIAGFIGIAHLVVAAAPAAGPTPEQALRLKPVQDQIDFDQPSAADAKKSSIKPEKQGKITAWVVRDPQSKILRRFADTNGDNVVDSWSYYKDGLEVYRDIDSDFNGKADQYRWLATAGTRWATDKNEDGKIDSWRLISPEEVAEEVVAAIQTNSPQRFASLLLTAHELKSLGAGEEHEKEIRSRLGSATKKFQELAAKMIKSRSQMEFLDFGGTRPGLLPQGTAGTSRDIIVHENVAALVQIGKGHEQILLGSLLKVGDTWKLVEGPSLASAGENTATSRLFLVPETNEPAAPDAVVRGGAGPSEEEQKLLEQLESLDQKVASSTGNERVKLNDQRVATLLQLVKETKEASQRNQWLRQLADMVSAEVQSGGYPRGIEHLKKLESELVRGKSDKDLIAHFQMRRITAEYTSELRGDDVDYNKVQQKWLEKLAGFVEKFPKSLDAAEALLQLGMAEEFSGNAQKAKGWYAKAAAGFPNTPVSKKASGAIRRLESEGKRMELSGKSVRGGQLSLSQYRGKVVLVQYWATWCSPCVADIARLKELYAQHKSRGFEIVGVSLDNSAGELASYLKSNPIPWDQIYESGGLESRLAHEYGVMTLPVMILVNQQGEVVNRGIHVAELDNELKTLLK